MGKIKRYRNVVERFLSGESGQRFFNVAYSLGAAVVILGALFKILHLSGGDLLLSVGMGTEVLMFILTAFDHPQRESMPVIAGGSGLIGGSVTPADADVRAEYSHSSGGGVVVIGGNGSGNGGGIGVNVGGNVAAAPLASIEGTEEMAAGVKQLGESIEEYVKKMEDLNRSIAGLNAMYEMQLRSASSQMDTADSVSRGMRQMREIYETTAQRSAEYGEEARRLTEHIRSLNRVYARMLEAMTHNPLAQGTMAAEPERNKS